MMAGAGEGILGTRGWILSSAVHWAALRRSRRIPGIRLLHGHAVLHGRWWKRSSARLLAVRKAGVTTGAEFAIGGAIAGQMAVQGGALAGIAGTLGTALPIAGAVIGGRDDCWNDAMEVYNSLTSGRRSCFVVVAVQGADETDWRRQSAIRNYLSANPGWRSSNRAILIVCTPKSTAHRQPSRRR